MRSQTGETVIKCFQSFDMSTCAQLGLSRLFSITHYYVLARRLSGPLEYPFERKPEGKISLMNEDDFALIKNNWKSFGQKDKKEILARFHFYESGFRNCYVVKRGNEIAYMQWMVLPHENELLARNYPRRFYPLNENQVMLENAFTFPRYRGLGYLQLGSLQLMEFAALNNFNSVICYIRKDRIAALNDFMRLGFRINKLVTEYRIFGNTWRSL